MIDIFKLCDTIVKAKKNGQPNGQSFVIPLPMKGNIRKCENNRTIRLISHPSQILLYVLLNIPTRKEYNENIYNLHILSENTLVTTYQSTVI